MKTTLKNICGTKMDSDNQITGLEKYQNIPFVFFGWFITCCVDVSFFLNMEDIATDLEKMEKISENYFNILL